MGLAAEGGALDSMLIEALLAPFLDPDVHPAIAELAQRVAASLQLRIIRALPG